METILGQSDKGCERQLHCWIKDGQIGLHIQSTQTPPNDAACIYIPLDVFVQMLNRLPRDTTEPPSREFVESRIEMYSFEELIPIAEIHGFTLTEKKLFVDYSLPDGQRYYEESFSEDGVSYHGTWGIPGERNPNRTVNLSRYESKSKDILLIGEWIDGVKYGGHYMYKIKATEPSQQ